MKMLIQTNRKSTWSKVESPSGNSSKTATRHPLTERSSKGQTKTIVSAVNASMRPHLRPIKVIQLTHFRGRSVLHIGKPLDKDIHSFTFGKHDVTQHVILVRQNLAQISRGIARMSRWVHDHTTGNDFAATDCDIDLGRNAVRIFRVEFWPTMGKCNF